MLGGGIAEEFLEGGGNMIRIKNSCIALGGVGTILFGRGSSDRYRGFDRRSLGGRNVVGGWKIRRGFLLSLGEELDFFLRGGVVGPSYFLDEEGR